MNENLYCKIFINSDKTIDELIMAIAALSDSHIRLRNIYIPFIEISVVESDDYDEQRMKSTYDGFLFFPYYLEIEPPQDVVVNSKQYKLLLKQLLVMIFEHGGSAIPMCDYEEELLGKNQLGQPDLTRYWRQPLNQWG